MVSPVIRRTVVAEELHTICFTVFVIVGTVCCFVGPEIASVFTQPPAATSANSDCEGVSQQTGTPGYCTIAPVPVLRGTQWTSAHPK